MAWKLRGTYVETCSCEFFCPCNFNLANGADYDRCKVTLVFNITDGEVDGTDVGGLAVVVIADTPKVITDGNWRPGTVIDAKASDEQAEKLQAVFSGELGGPMAARGPLVGENLGVQRAPIEVRDDGLHHSVRIGDSTGFDVEDVVPFGVETGEPRWITGILHPAASEFVVAKAKSADVSLFGIDYQGKSAITSGAILLLGRLTALTAQAGGLRPVEATQLRAPGSASSRFCLTLAVLAWWFTVDRMRGMDDGPGTDLG